MLFPLPLVAFEEYMLADDRPAYPMNFFAGLRFDGIAQPDALVSAVAHARGRHPLLAARVQEIGRRWHWIPAGANFRQVHWTGLPPEAGFPAYGPIDLSREPGLRVQARVGDGCTYLDLQFHHATSDGLGAFRFINDLLVSYDAAVRGDVSDARLHRLDPELLLRRGTFGLTPGKFLRILPKQLVGLLGVRQFLMRRPVTLARDQETPASPTSTSPVYPAVATAVLDCETTERLWVVAAERGVTANDLLLGDLFVALDDWRRKRRSPRPSDWLRIAVPMNLRTAADRRLPAANVTTMVFLDRRPEEISDADALLAGVQDEMQLIKRLRLGLTFNFSLAAARRLPGGLARMAKKDRGMSTAVLTNLGDPLAKTPLKRMDGRLVVGDMTLDGMELAAPIRPHTAAAVAVWKDARRLNVTLHFDAHRLSRADADAMLSGFLEQIRATVGTSRPLMMAH